MDIKSKQDHYTASSVVGVIPLFINIKNLISWTDECCHHTCLCLMGLGVFMEEFLLKQVFGQNNSKDMKKMLSNKN